MTTIADVIAIARDMALDALDRGEPVAWIANRRARTPPEIWLATRTNAAPITGELTGGWDVRRLGAYGYAYKRGWTTERVREAFLAGIAVLDPSTIESTVAEAAKEDVRIETTTTVRARLPEAPVPGVYTNIVPGHVTRIMR